MSHTIGLISDTHGLVRSEVLRIFRGCEMLLHAGDIGGQEVLDVLRKVAPVVAIRGNIDTGGWCSGLPETEMLNVGNVSFYMLHHLADLSIDPPAAGVRVVVSGHSHEPLIRTADDVLYINPGSAGPKRFHLPVSVCLLEITDSVLDPRIILLDQ